MARADAATEEAERLRRENNALRQAMTAPQYAYPYPQQPMMMPPLGMIGAAYPAHVIYQGDVRMLPLQERARLSQHTLSSFPTAVVVLLHIFTFGLFNWIHFGLKHDALPKAAADDPGAGKAIGFHLIPFFNLYWNFFQPLRLCDRLDLQAKLRGLPPVAPRGLVMACCIMMLIPLANYIALLIMWPIASGMTQSAINKIAAMPPSTFDATPPPALPPGYPPLAGYPQQPY